ncbi:hypothetical protein RC74_20930 [Falsihalocynthiibacter arcticus]|uniref:Uncharacterized protein n=1 Tax=Falsihalocynthiibacter arcticus TaxID=1579316 RepID=A0A126V514_9RHOB|nr:hypothetical protein RC74_20930 [Falsihalocynthiibacter arcticus]
MVSKGSLVLFGIVKGMTLVAILVFTIFPRDLSAHEDPRDVASISISHESPNPSHPHKELEAQSGHCHPGIDCFVPAVFFLNTEILITLRQMQTNSFFVRPNGESWLLLHESPPPRFWS